MPALPRDGLAAALARPAADEKNKKNKKITRIYRWLLPSSLVIFLFYFVSYFFELVYAEGCLPAALARPAHRKA